MKAKEEIKPISELEFYRRLNEMDNHGIVRIGRQIRTRAFLSKNWFAFIAGMIIMFGTWVPIAWFAYRNANFVMLFCMIAIIVYPIYYRLRIEKLVAVFKEEVLNARHAYEKICSEKNI